MISHPGWFTWGICFSMLGILSFSDGTDTGHVGRVIGGLMMIFSGAYALFSSIKAAP